MSICQFHALRSNCQVLVAEPHIAEKLQSTEGVETGYVSLAFPKPVVQMSFLTMKEYNSEKCIALGFPFHRSCHKETVVPS
jgi:hypothetical protein